jgi:hypothetical protein
VGRFFHGTGGQKLKALRNQSLLAASAATDVASQTIGAATHTTKELVNASITVFGEAMRLGDENPGAQAAAMAAISSATFGVGEVHDLSHENFANVFMPPFAAAALSHLVAKSITMMASENSAVLLSSATGMVAGTQTALALGMQHVRYDPGALFTATSSFVAAAIGLTLSRAEPLWNSLSTHNAPQVWGAHVANAVDIALNSSAGATAGFVLGRSLSESLSSNRVMSSAITTLSAGAGAIGSGGFTELRNRAIDGLDNTLSTQARRSLREVGRLYDHMKSTPTRYANAHAIASWERSAPPGLETHYAEVAQQFKQCQSDPSKTTLTINNPHVTDLPPLPPSIKQLNLNGCKNLAHMPDVKNCANLRLIEMTHIPLSAQQHIWQDLPPNCVARLNTNGLNPAEKKVLADFRQAQTTSLARWILN